ncbi:hypothetical protein JOD03_002118 [Chryseomicrobium aureum]|nr:hypothetical protein [Chryseomicrobium aureum]
MKKILLSVTFLITLFFQQLHLHTLNLVRQIQKTGRN